MPSRSRAERRFWEAAEHNAEFAKKAGVKQSTAKEFTQADKAVSEKSLPERVGKKTRKEKRNYK